MVAIRLIMTDNVSSKRHQVIFCMKTTLTLCRTIFLFVLTFLLGACSGDFLIEDSRIAGLSDTRTESEVWDGTVATAFAGGSGTVENPYQIANGAQLAKLAQDVNGGNNYDGTYFVLTADILLNDISDWESWETTAPTNSWTPIGSNYEQPFTGTLDGDGHSVSGIYINSTANYQGLVGYLGKGGTLQNLGVEASYIKGGSYVGGLCGGNSGTVTNCYNTGSVTGSGKRVGGLCGDNGGTVTHCYNTGSVEGNSYVGGVCGDNSDNVSNCYNTGSVTGTGDSVGGVCGDNMWGTVINCYNSGSVKGTGSNISGVCGLNEQGTVTNCYNAGSVEGNNSVGGLCGYNKSGTVTNSHNTGSITGSYDAGGVCGRTWSGAVANCYYLDICGAAGVGTSKTETEFQSGAVAWLLSEGKNGEIWGQNLTFEPKDSYPVLGGLKVVQNGDGYKNELSQDSDFYLISTADELRLFASMVNNGNPDINGRLTADIELNNTTGWENWGSTPPANSWTPIGNCFIGTFDGQGHTISGLYVNDSDYSSYYAGLFGCLEDGGTVENVGVTKSYIQGGNAGGIVGFMYGGTIRNCYCTGIVRCQGGFGGGRGGGIAGMSYGSDNITIENCYFAGSISSEFGADEWIGPIVGGMHAEYVNPTNCYYLEECGASGKGTPKTADEFKSGEVASLLGDGWGQTIGTDDYPVPTSDASKKVYAYTMYQGQSTETGYANNNGNVDLDLTSHPNTIAVFEASGTFAGTNIVVKVGDNNYTCAELVLTDGADFYTPVAFTATNATYTRTPSVWATNNGSGSGWETLCLPFSGTLYADDVAKQPVDVASNNGAYWLRSLTGFETPNTLIFASPATAADNQIEAGVPYIIALPGNTFGGESLQGQTISVRGTNVKVTNTAQSVQPEGSLFAFTGTFATKACDAASYRLNSENGSNGAGNLFVLDTNKLAPFRCRVDVKGLNIGGRSRSDGNLPTQLRIGQ